MKNTLYQGFFEVFSGFSRFCFYKKGTTELGTLKKTCKNLIKTLKKASGARNFHLIMIPVINVAIFAHGIADMVGGQATVACPDVAPVWIEPRVQFHASGMTFLNDKI